MSFLTYLTRLWLERRIRVLSVDVARARDELDNLEVAYQYDHYERDIHYAIIDERARIKTLEAERNLVTARLSQVAATP